MNSNMGKQTHESESLSDLESNSNVSTSDSDTSVMKIVDLSVLECKQSRMILDKLFKPREAVIVDLRMRSTD